jgi:hypothetical protein
VVLTHGLQPANEGPDNLWTGTGNSQAAHLIQIAMQGQGRDVNVLQYIWKGAFQGPRLPIRSSYVAARNYALDAGHQLASLLIGALGPNGNYTHKIHFIGHSLGTVVNTYAAKEFLKVEANVEKAQFTALDRPDHIDNIPGSTESGGWSGCIPSCFETVYGFDKTFFASQLPTQRLGEKLKIDNYYSLTGFAVGDVANGPVYNHPRLEHPGDLQLGNVFGVLDHSGVQEWYRWTIRANNPLSIDSTTCEGAEVTFSTRFAGFYNNSLNPCEKGWFWSIL